MKKVCLRAALLFAAIFSVSAQNQAVTIPSGTAIQVRTIDPISVETAHPGATFRGSLAEPVKGRGGAVMIPRGAEVRLSVVSVEKSSRISGRDKLFLRADSIAFHGRSFPVVTSVYQARGKGKGSRTLSRTGIGAGAGALIGGLAGGGTGLAVGALVGGGGGTAVAAATGGKHLTLPPESVLSFQLQSPLRVR